MFRYIQAILVIVLEILCYKIYFEVFAKRKVNLKYDIGNLLFVIMILLDFYIVLLFSSKFIIKTIIIVCLNSALMQRIFFISIKRSIILTTLFHGLLVAIDYFDLVIINYFFLNFDKSPIIPSIGGALFTLLGKMILLLCIIFFKRLYGYKSSDTLTEHEWVKFLFCPIITICSITAMITNFESVENQNQADILFIIAFGLIGINIVFFYLINDILERGIKIRKNKLLEMQVQNQLDTYYSIYDNFNKQRKKVHEYKNWITCINAIIKKKQYVELELFLTEISDGILKELDFIDTNNTIVNAIVNVKYQEARDKGIIFVMKINDLSCIQIKDNDVVIILSNLLDNAIEASSHCDMEKIIRMKFVINEQNIIISVKNTYKKEPKFISGVYQTIKEENVEEHGLGIENIKKTVESYNGSYVIRHGEGIFYFSIVMPL